MDWLLGISIAWLSIDIIIVATGWYLVTTIRPLYPDWWKRVIVDDEPKLCIDA